MTGDCHVRLRERLKGRFLWSTRLRKINLISELFLFCNFVRNMIYALEKNVLLPVLMARYRLLRFG